MKKTLFLLVICLFALSLSILTAINCKAENDKNVSTAATTGQFELKGFVYLGTNIPAGGKVVYVVSPEFEKRYATIVDQNGYFSINFPECEQFGWGIEGYTTNQYISNMTQNYGVFTLFVNIISQ